MIATGASTRQGASWLGALMVAAMIALVLLVQCVGAGHHNTTVAAPPHHAVAAGSPVQLQRGRDRAARPPLCPGCRRVRRGGRCCRTVVGAYRGPRAVDRRGRRAGLDGDDRTGPGVDAGPAATYPAGGHHCWRHPRTSPRRAASLIAAWPGVSRCRARARVVFADRQLLLRPVRGVASHVQRFFTMNNILRGRVTGLAVAASAVTAAVTVLLAPAAHAGPGGLGDADDVINSLKAQGNKVIVTKTGNKPMPQCVATRVRKDLDVYGGTPSTNCPNCNGASRRNQVVRLYSVYHVDIQC